MATTSDELKPSPSGKPKPSDEEIRKLRKE